ncbi:hypothetical protein [Hymenobacter lapidiphilus]|uniref:Uncharacterized protein n=1 Tax=Hymenobacter lapidiphilus TaxID=2608003 RepID=A0A7Y7PNP2_9BACT|nr:hypothetical protein [Hymenobacter lapidiphilus]NVO31178.1 hypothetical protein [Hymenobacter lapidiphilus]
MDSKEDINRLTKAVFICLAFLLLTGFYYHLDKYVSGFIFITIPLTIVILFLSIVIYTIKYSLNLFQRIDRFKLINIIPAILYYLTLIYLFFSPYQFSSERLESQVMLRGCYEGTQNQATIKFRRNKTFELHWTGIFFSSSWYTGNYTQRGDTLILDYKSEKPIRFGHLVAIQNGELRTVETASDSLKNIVPFYLGYCKHLN